MAPSPFIPNMTIYASTSRALKREVCRNGNCGFKYFLAYIGPAKSGVGFYLDHMSQHKDHEWQEWQAGQTRV